MDYQKKRNHSDLSDTSTGSPALQPKKSYKMSLDANQSSEQGDAMDQEELDRFEDQIKGMSLDDKVNEILKTVRAQQVKNVLDVRALQTENRELQLQLQQSNGMVARLASRVTALEEKVVSMEAHALKKNILIYNIPEINAEDIHKETENFLSSILKIPESVLFSKTNPGAEIRIDVAHRIGQKGAKPRPIVVSFTTQQGRNMVLSYTKNLKATQFAMSEQLPATIRERRTAQIPLMVKMRDEARRNNSSASIRLVKDKLYVNNNIISDHFEANPLNYHVATNNVIDNDLIKHSTPRVVKNSVFQGHYFRIHTKDDAIQMLRALHQNDVAESDHLIYAYRLTDADGQAMSGHSDDGEWNASNILKDLLQRHGQSEVILVVSRKFGGIKLGKQRFDIIKQVASEVLPRD